MAQNRAQSSICDDRDGYDDIFPISLLLETTLMLVYVLAYKA